MLCSRNCKQYSSQKIGFLSSKKTSFLHQSGRGYVRQSRAEKEIFSSTFMWIHGIELRSLELAQIPLTFETGFLFLGSYYSFWLYCMRKKSMRVSVVDIKSQASCHTSLITYPMVKKIKFRIRLDNKTGLSQSKN